MHRFLPRDFGRGLRGRLGLIRVGEDGFFDYTHMVSSVIHGYAWASDLPRSPALSRISTGTLVASSQAAEAGPVRSISEPTAG